MFESANKVKEKTRQESLIVGTKKVTFQSNYVKYYMVIQPKLAILLLFKSKSSKKKRKKMSILKSE